jgi:hypothetical protein
VAGSAGFNPAQCPVSALTTRLDKALITYHRNE